jgi:hypothetical protein
MTDRYQKIRDALARANAARAEAFARASQKACDAFMAMVKLREWQAARRMKKGSSND